MPVRRLAPVQKELILEWMGESDTPFTVEDMAVRYDVHDQTARAWINQLRDEGLVTEHPMRKGRRVQFIRTKEGDAAAQGGEAVYRDPDDVAIRVVRGKEQVTPAEWSRGNLQNSSVVLGAACLQYLFTRSYYAESPDHQHLRGTVPPVEVRAFFAELVKDLELNLEAMRQFLAYNAPWVEGGEFARRFGMMDNLAASMQVATQVEAKITEWKAAKK